MNMDEEIEGWIEVRRTGNDVEVEIGGIYKYLSLDEAEDLWRKLGEALGKDAGKGQG
jgi:hypothetical protein